MLREASFVLPYPHHISVNNIWKISKYGVYLSPIAKRYFKDVFFIVYSIPKFEEDLLRVEIKMYPPDLRKRDIDNILKITLDSLQHAKLYNNDNQVEELYVKKMHKVDDGMLEVKIQSLLSSN